MTVQIACPNTNCDASYTIAEKNLGRMGRCKKCRMAFPLVPLTRPGMPPASATEPDLFPDPRPPIEVDLPSSFGRYRIVRVLGSGGMGAVYLAHDGQLDRPVALKVPHRELARNADVRERFLREARAAARFHHPNFCPIHDIGEVDGVPYLTMAYIEGGTLASTIERGKPWDQSKAAEVVRQLAVALAEAHRQGVIHRDLKPANVMIDPRGGLVLMDFGLARRFEGDDPTLTAAGAVLGTPAYMPPEQAEGNLAAIGPRSDVYSLGVIFYELLTGHRPFEGPTTKILGMIVFVEPASPSTLRPDLDPCLEAICLKAMAKKPDARHASMGELAAALASFLADEAAPPPVVPLKEVENGPPRPNPPIRIAVAAAAFAALLFGLIVYVATDKGRIKIEVNDANAVVLVDGQQVRIEGPGDPITLRAGEHNLSVKRGDVEVETRKFVVRRGDNPALSVSLEPPKEAPQAQPMPPAVARADPPVAPSRPTAVPKDEVKPAPPLDISKPDATLITNALGMKLKLIPAGDFGMGSDAADTEAVPDEQVNGKKHHVTITRSFYLGTTEVTVGQFGQFIEESKYRTEAEEDGKGGYGWDEKKGSFEQGPMYTWRSPGFRQEDDHPVVNVSWNDAVAFCHWLGQKEGRTYRLPTEAEWEYACRAGQASQYPSGNDPESLATEGNLVDGTARKKYPNLTHAIMAEDGFVFTAPVGHFRPNAFGLFDMRGNAWEWCADWYDPDYYAKSPPADPLNSSPASDRVNRGGSWYFYPRCARSASRNKNTPGYRNNELGFRVARVRSGP